MALPTLLTTVAFLASLLLLLQHRPLLFPILAAAASGFELATALGFIHLSVARLSLGLVFGVALAVAGLAVYARAAAKGVIAAATLVTLVGALQTFTALHLR